ncbi:MAG TPA: 4Fe-4S dicluster domain-containing protein, partial [Longimicrobium sp.]|nr:4Fe-4S dicluster domain-containing protein [Longimicrobium sp.]
VSLDADFLASGPFHLRHAHDFARRRRTPTPTAEMNRLYVAGPQLTPTASMADHRLRVRAGDVRHAASALFDALAGHGIVIPGERPAAASVADPRLRAWAGAAARDLAAHRGAAIVIAGEGQPAEVHAAAHLLNAALGNLGRTVRLTEPVLAGAGDAAAGIPALAGAMAAGAVDTLVMLGVNPVYDTPGDLGFAGLLGRVPHSIHQGLYVDETAAASAWHVPALHYLESWGDARALDGTRSIVQPLIRPLYEASRGAADLLAIFAGVTDSAHDLLRGGFDGGARGAWDRVLQRGLVPGSAAPAVAVAPRFDTLPALFASPVAGADAGLEIVFPPDASVYDGRFANLGWLQELPDPATKLTWENAALLSPRTAARHAVEPGDMVRLTLGRRSVRVPVVVLPGQADECVVLPLGYGRRAPAERACRGIGVDANALRTTASPSFAAGARITRLFAGEGMPLRHPLAITQAHDATEDRPIALHASLERYRADPEFTRQRRGRALSLYRPFAYTGEQWAMTIDLSLCTGCSACVVACQAENNVPVVGRDGVMRGRVMHWLRVDRYWSGDPENPLVMHQPMMCQQCEKAPCEYVCPVGATVHSPDGLNEMVYNRCVGTRFCSNNCPYKVRRFNWFAYDRDRAETERMLMNPDVTVRDRGVMEKCTYCVQRIRRHQIAAKTGNPEAAPGPLQTACQQACPTRAIVFGSLGDADAAVVATRREPRAYAVLDELGTEPRTRYLAKITNPAPGVAAPGDPEPRG